MSSTPEFFPRFSALGESAILVELGDTIHLTINEKIRALDTHLLKFSIPGILEQVPAYASLLIYFDPVQIEFSEVLQWIKDSMLTLSDTKADSTKRVMIPVRYGGEAGPDLMHVAEFHGMTPAEVVEKHIAPIYRVGMMGFTPGFAYLIGLDHALATPRRATPRSFVPAGSVGIAGGQTGVYPLDSPGGWQIIGRTEQKFFDPAAVSPFLLSPGDEVQFIRVNGGLG